MRAWLTRLIIFQCVVVVVVVKGGFTGRETARQ